MSVSEISGASSEINMSWQEGSVGVFLINPDQTFEESQISALKPLYERIQVIEENDNFIKTIVDNVLVIKEPSKKVKEAGVSYWEEKTVISGGLAAIFSLGVVVATVNSFSLSSFVAVGCFLTVGLGTSAYCYNQMTKWQENYSETFAEQRKTAFVQGFQYIMEKDTYYRSFAGYRSSFAGYRSSFAALLTRNEKQGLHLKFFKDFAHAFKNFLSQKERYAFLEKAVKSSPLSERAIEYSRLSSDQKAFLAPSFQKYLEFVHLFTEAKKIKANFINSFSSQVQSKVDKIKEKKQKELSDFPVLTRQELPTNTSTDLRGMGTDSPFSEQNQEQVEGVPVVEGVPIGTTEDERVGSLYPEVVPMGTAVEAEVVPMGTAVEAEVVPMGTAVEDELPTFQQIEEREQIRKKIAAFFDRKIAVLDEVGANYEYTIKNIFEKQAARLYFNDVASIHKHGYLTLTGQNPQDIVSLPDLKNNFLQQSDIWDMTHLGISYQREVDTIFEQALREVFV